MAESTETRKGNGNDAYFRWIVSGILGVVGVLASVLWVMLMGNINDARADIKALSSIVYDMKSDLKLHTEQIKDLAAQIGELQGAQRKR